MVKWIGAVVIDTDRCKGCDLCVVACPRGVLALSPRAVNHKGYAYCIDVNPTDCTGCASCAIVCPDGCISVYRAKSADISQEEKPTCQKKSNC